MADNGRDFAPENADRSGGFGLTCLKERAARLGADLVIQAQPGEGTRVQVTIAVPKEVAP